MGGREYIESEVAERARHRTGEDARRTCSIAKAERLFGREYHGRFLIELLQNAADAWRDARGNNEKSRVAVVVGEGPSLLVANQGTPMSAETVIRSLGHIGASPKLEGEAIGYKGIGFKSVLEISLTPEIYSGLQEPSASIAVSFDPLSAQNAIRDATPNWDDLLSEVMGLDADDDLAAIPVLQFPRWLDEWPPDVQKLAADGFDTVMRLPFDARYEARLGLNAEAWLRVVREGVEEVTDQILLLLGCFDCVTIHDRLSDARTAITPVWEQLPADLNADDSKEVVRVLRNEDLSSRWILYRRTLPDGPDLAGEIAVGVRLSDEPDCPAVLAAIGDGASAPFHLFFPTTIASGLPFLVHGYFEVDASRKGFYPGSQARNEQILRELSTLVAVGVNDIAQSHDVDLVSLVNLVARSSEPEDALARNFRDSALTALDACSWIPVELDEHSVDRERPAQVFGWSSDLTRLLVRTFPGSYVRSRVGLALPDKGLSAGAIELVISRGPGDSDDQWSRVADLCRPGSLDVWSTGEVDTGFLALLDLFAAMDVADGVKTKSLLGALAGDPESRLIPSASPNGGRTLLPVPNPAEGVPGNRSQLVMARVRMSGDEPLVPPPELDVAFLPDGLLTSEADVDRAKPLGVRPFTVDNILDRLNGIEESTVDGKPLVQFLWKLLARERQSMFGTRHSAERAADFDPKRWFWCQPGRGFDNENDRLRQRRERYLAAVPLPGRDGTWRSAGHLAFGSDWADWLTSAVTGSVGAVSEKRVEAYRALEAICPGDRSMLASPEVILPLLVGETLDELPEAKTDEDVISERDEAARNRERHAFLLRLGVWELPPIEAFESRDPGGRRNFPWNGQSFDRQQEIIQANGGWRFGLEGWSGQQHHNVYVAEDYRFEWQLESMARRNGASLTTLLRLGASFYGSLDTMNVFCPGCADSGSSHTARRSSGAADRMPSILAIQLRDDAWVPCIRDDEPAPEPVRASTCWWHPSPPTGSALRQSPLRFLQLCSPNTGIDDELQRLAAISNLEVATFDAISSLLEELREGYEQRLLAPDPLGSSSARQAFISLHRVAYERLASFAAEDGERVGAILGEVGLLCNAGDQLTFVPSDAAYHDDGRFGALVRYFAGKIPFVVIAREREATANRLGIAPFRVALTRHGDDEGVDVTEDLQEILADRIPELLAIVVNHSLGSQTLELGSEQFDERSRRLSNLRVVQLGDLVIHAKAEGTDVAVTIGEGSDQDLFLQGPTSSHPVLFIDLAGEGWQDRLRRKISSQLATVLENPAYDHTFALFLQAENDGEREDFLQDLGISTDDVDVISSAIGAVSDAQRQRQLRWFTAILQVLDQSVVHAAPTTEYFVERLMLADFAAAEAHQLAEFAGSEEVRRDLRSGGALAILAAHGLDLRELDQLLRAEGDVGLTVSAARTVLARWVATNGRRVAGVLAAVMPSGEAKAVVRGWHSPPEYEWSLEPPLSGLLEPVVSSLVEVGFAANANALATDAAAELLRLSGLASPDELDARVDALYDEEEQRRFLRALAAAWRRELRLLGVLARIGPTDSRSAIRALHEKISGQLFDAPERPTDLIATVDELLSQHPALASAIVSQLIDSVTVPPPDREQLLVLAAQSGLPIERVPAIERAIDGPRRERARKLLDRKERLAIEGIEPLRPRGFTKIAPKPTRVKTAKIETVKIGESHDRRKRSLGDEGEQWALAAVLRPLLDADLDTRVRAIDEVVELLGCLNGGSVNTALSHAELCRAETLDEEELIDELAGLLHVSTHSDGFGFDLVGWLPPAQGESPQAIFLEVKSSSGEGFILSRSEWDRAKSLSVQGQGDRYAVLVVRRAKRGGQLSGMDLLTDPVALVGSGDMALETDTYQVRYHAE